MTNEVKNKILAFLQDYPLRSSKEIHNGLSQGVAYATVKRLLNQLIEEKLIAVEGKGKATRYKASPSYGLLYPIDIEKYFRQEQDERLIKGGFGFFLINDTLPNVDLFEEKEQQYLNALHINFMKNIEGLSQAEFSREQERLAIDLSWKSSQIEGNTYSLLETERLLKEKETAEGKPKDDAVMLLNHKEAISFIIEHPDYMVPLSIGSIEDIHSLLIKDLGVDRNIRQKNSFC